MLLISKELKGKAIPFMEWCNKSNIELQIHRFMKILDFYSQPFTPEMLTEYFDEEWIQESDDINYELIINKERKACIYLDFYPNFCEYTFGDLGDNMFVFKSLNDLITLCTLAGVELTWKLKLKQ